MIFFKYTIFSFCKTIFFTKKSNKNMHPKTIVGITEKAITQKKYFVKIHGLFCDNH